MKSKVVIVTPDLVGPVKCGGIGTHCYELSLALAEDGYNVTVLFTGHYEHGDRNRFKKEYSEKRVTFEDISSVPEPSYNECGGEWFSFRSMRVMEYLRENRFRIAHFQDWQADGFASIQAKRTGKAFDDTILTVTIHSPAQWQREGMAAWPANPIADSKQDFCERYCCENADILISPSSRMLQWVESQGWRVSGARRVLRNLYHKRGFTCNPVAPDWGHMAFFGRIETRKGIEVFCEALDSLVGANDAGTRPIKRISFVGKEGELTDGEPAINLVESFMKKWEQDGVSSSVHTGYDRFEALDYLSSTGATAVVPSLLDNYPYVVIECLENNIPLLAARTGGIPEMVSDYCLFDPTWPSLREALLDRESRIGLGKPIYSAVRAREEWLGFMAELETTNAVGRAGFAERKHQPRVSVIIPHFNMGKSLPDCLDSVARSDYPDYEVIVVDDGSNDQQSVDVFTRMEERYRDRGGQFITQENMGPGVARNRAASHGTGEYLVFVDADNVVTPTMISQFIKGVQASGADCLTCHFLAFEDGSDPMAEGFSPAYSYRPLGACLEAGLIQNVFGDTNFCVKKQVFEALGGFAEERLRGCEDWEFLVRLCLKGYTLDVIPDSLFFYRITSRGRSRGPDLYGDHLFVLRAYLDSRAGPWVERALAGLLIPYALNAQKDAEYDARHGRKLGARFAAAFYQRLQDYPRLKEVLKILARGIIHIMERMTRGPGSRR